MNYPNLEEIRQIETWVNNNLAPQLSEALKLESGQLVKKVGVLKKGVKIVEWLGKAKEANRVMYEL